MQGHNHLGRVTGGDKSTRCSQTWVQIFINKYYTHLYSNSLATVEASSFGAELCAMKARVQMVVALRQNLSMFVVPIDVSDNVLCDNKNVYKNTITPESVVKKKQHSVVYHMYREAVANNTTKVANREPVKIYLICSPILLQNQGKGSYLRNSLTKIDTSQQKIGKTPIWFLSFENVFPQCVLCKCNQCIFMCTMHMVR